MIYTNVNAKFRERLPPPGRLLEIAYEGQRCSVTESGATLRSYDSGGRAVVEPFDGPEAPVVGCQGEILAPWPNRVVDGRWSWRGEPYQLSVTEPERGHALHGLVRNLTWQVTDHRADRMELEVLLLAHPGWPFPLHLTASYRLGPGGLVSEVTATNAGREPCPYGVAVHPYLAVPSGTVDDVVLHLPAATWLATDDRLAPTGRRPAHAGPWCFSDGKPLGDRRVDNAFTDLAGAPGGGPQATVVAPDGSTTTLWGGSTVKWWQLFTGDALPPRWRRRALALEPMTCPPDALNSGEDLVVLEPGESHTMTWGLSFSGTAATAIGARRRREDMEP